MEQNGTNDSNTYGRAPTGSEVKNFLGRGVLQRFVRGVITNSDHLAQEESSHSSRETARLSDHCT